MARDYGTGEFIRPSHINNITPDDGEIIVGGPDGPERVVLSDILPTAEDMAAVESAVVRLDSLEADRVPAAEWTATKATINAVTTDVAQALSGTTGVSITNIRPGRIDARVRGVSTASSDNTTLLHSLLQEAAVHGAEMWLPEGVYRASLAVDNTMNRARLAGTGTIQGVGGGAPVTLVGGVDGFTLTGVGLDGAGVKSCLLTSGSGSVSGVTIERCRFANTAPTGFTDSYIAIRDTIGMERTAILGNVFESTVGGGIAVMTPNSLQVANNRFDGTSEGNFISINLYAGAAWGGGDGVVITGNVGRNGARMGVEFFNATGGSAPYARSAVIAHNWFDVTGGTMGISVVGTDATIVEGNTVIGDANYGIEVGNLPHIVRGNAVHGFLTGIILNQAALSTVEGNLIRGCRTGITTTTTNSGRSVAMATIRGNTIIDPVEVGVSLGVGAGGVNGLEVIEDNLIVRSQASTGDSTRTFRGISSPLPTSGPRTIRRNRIVQAHTAPTLAGFRFLEFSGTNTWPSTVEGNMLVNLGTSAFGVGITSVAGSSASVQGMSFRDNHFGNLADLTNADLPASSGSSGNTMRGPSDLSALHLFGLSVPPARYGDYSATSTNFTHIRGASPSTPVSGDGYWKVGDIILNSAPVAGGSLGWVCVTAGNPGTWKTWGAIAP